MKKIIKDSDNRNYDIDCGEGTQKSGYLLARGEIVRSNHLGYLSDITYVVLGFAGDGLVRIIERVIPTQEITVHRSYLYRV